MNNTKTSQSRKNATYRYLKKQRLELLEFLGNKCVRCGFDDVRALQFDHIHGGGNKEYGRGRNNESYRFYNKNKDQAKLKLQILCANCNWIKKSKNGEVKHV